MTRKLADVRLAVVASPALIDALRPACLADLPWLAWDRTVDAGEERWLQAAVPNARVVLRSTELETLIQAARGGAGAVVLGLRHTGRCGRCRASRRCGSGSWTSSRRSGPGLRG